MSIRRKRRWIRRGAFDRRERHRRCSAFGPLFTEALEKRLLLATVSSVDPLPNSSIAPVSTNVSATYDEVINAATATTANFVVSSRQGGLLGAADATVTAAGNTVTLDPNSGFFAGDRVQVTSTSGIQGTSAGVPRVWEFRTAASGGLGTFEDSGQSLGIAASNTRSFALALGDLDSDGDMDIFVANQAQGSRVYLNDGNAVFNDSGQSLGSTSSRDVALGDLDGDGDMDAVIANTSGEPNRVWQNNGSGVFTEVQSLGANSSQDVKLGDLDGDGDLDAFFANTGGNRVWLNTGGVLSDSVQSLGDHTSLGVALGDVDGDGDLDAFSGNTLGQNDRVWINNGSGLFSDSGQALFTNLTAKSSRDVVMGDVDGDGDLDAFVVGRSYNNRLFLNDGNGVFTDSGQVIDAPVNPFFEYGAAMGDVDADGDLDIVTSGEAIAHWNRLFLNDGDGVFTESGQVIGGQTYGVDTMGTFGIELGDLDGDGDLDVAFANDNTFPNTNSTARVWLNQNPVTTVTLSIDNTSMDEAAGVATVTTTLSGPSAQAVTVNLGITGTAAATDDYVASDSQIVVAPGATTGSITITAVQDALDEADETVVVDIASITGAQGTGQVITTIVDDDPTPTVMLVLDSDTIAEDAGVATFTAILSAASGRDVTVELESTGTATENEDYSLSSTQIAIPEGSISGTVTLTATQDGVDELDETVIVDIVNATGATEDGTQQQTVSIVDDDDPPLVALAVDNASIPEDGGVAAFTASLTGLSVSPVTIDLAISGSATLDTDYTLSGTQIIIAPGDSSGSITVTSIADINITEGGETVIVDIASVTNGVEDGLQQATATIIDDVNGPDVTLSIDNANIAENGGTATLTVTLANTFSLAVTVDFGFSGSAAESTDYNTSAAQVVIPPDSTTGTITVTAVQDTLPEADETVDVDIINVINGSEAGGQQQQTVTINDDDPAPTVSLSVDTVSIAEAAGVAVVTATLSGASGQDVIVDLGFTGDATPTDDYTNSATQITIAAGATTGSISIIAVDDDIDDDDEAVNVDITNVTNATEDGVQQVTVTIADDDDPPPAPPGVTPLNASFDAPSSTNLTATFSNNINGETATAQTFVVHGAQGGPLLAADATVTTSGATVTLNPSSNFFAGEKVQATVTSGIQEVGGAAIVPQVWQFQLAAGGSAEFSESGQSLGDPALNTRSWDVVLGDVDNDGDLDAFMANLGVGYANGAANRVYLNDGAGVFTDSGQSLGSHNSRHPSFGDMDGDGDLDAVVPNQSGHGNRIWENDGNGVFTERQVFGGNNSEDLELADLDADGDLDVFVANNGQGNRVWRNDGGTLVDTGQSLGNHISGNVALGDLDDDGDIDAYVVNSNQHSRMWINDGNGQFTDSGQMMGFHFNESVALGDVDGDGDLDVWVANNDYASRVWINNGSGEFADSGQQLFLSYNTSRIEDVELGDLDGDGDLDAFTVNNNSQPSRVWANDGSGVFSDFSGTSIDINTNSLGVALGDVNGDGSLDAVVANDAIFGGTNSPGRVWLNQVLTPTVTLSIDNTTLPEDGGGATVTASLSAAFGSDVTVELGFSGTADAADYTASGTQIVIPSSSTSGSITLTSNDDATDEPDETIVVEITAVTNGQGSGQVTATILDDDEPVVPSVSISVDTDNIPEDAGAATFSVSLSEATTLPVTVDLAVSGTAAASDYTISATQVVIAAGATSDSVTVTAVQDADDEDNETVIVDIDTVTNGTEDSVQQATTTIIDDDGPASFTVTSFINTNTGFIAQFNAVIDTAVLNIYDTSAGFGVADVVLTGENEGSVVGSVVVDPSLQMMTFITSGGVLAADTYTATLRSAADGLVDSDGRLLDGNADGTAGDDYSSTFTIVESAAGTVTLGLPNVVRGPGQDVNVPASASGIPLTISEGAGVRSVTVSIDHDASQLAITGATVGANMPAGATVAVDSSTTGTAVLTFTSPVDLPAGSHTLVNLTANVPADDPNAIYGDMQVLDIHSALVADASSNSIPVLDNDALHVAEFFADVSGNGRVNAADAAQTAQFAALLIDGFAAFPLADPIVVGDVSGNERINAADASQIAQFAALLPVPTIPPIPGGIVIAGQARADLGPALPGVLTPTATATQRLRPNHDSGSSTHLGQLATAKDFPYPAVDHALTELSTSGALGEKEELRLTLEAAIEELLGSEP